MLLGRGEGQPPASPLELSTLQTEAWLLLLLGWGILVVLLGRLVEVIGWIRHAGSSWSVLDELGALKDLAEVRIATDLDDYLVEPVLDVGHLLHQRLAL